MNVMNNEKNSIRQIILTVGFLTFIGMVVYFMVMKVAGFAHISELRFLNVIIAAIGGVSAIRYYNSKHAKRIKYLQGFMLSFASIFSASVLFAGFIFCYFSFIDPELLNVIRVDAPVAGIRISPVTTFISVLTEGAVSALVISFIAMQYFKDDSLHAPYKSVSTRLRTEEE